MSEFKMTTVEEMEAATNLVHEMHTQMPHLP